MINIKSSTQALLAYKMAKYQKNETKNIHILKFTFILESNLFHELVICWFKIWNNICHLLEYNPHVCLSKGKTYKYFSSLINKNSIRQRFRDGGFIKCSLGRLPKRVSSQSVFWLPLLVTEPGHLVLTSFKLSYNDVDAEQITERWCNC